MLATRNLRQELKARKVAGEQNLYIKHGKIMSRQADKASAAMASN